MNDAEAERLADWRTAVMEYGIGLEEMLAGLRDKIDAVPNIAILAMLAKKSSELERLGRSFRIQVVQVVGSEPPLPPRFKAAADDNEVPNGPT